MIAATTAPPSAPIMTDAPPHRHEALAVGARPATSGLVVFGAAMTAHQLLWATLGVALLGGTGRAQALVLATFMAGMAVGAHRHGRRVGHGDGRARLVRLQVAIAAWTLVLPFAVRLVADLSLPSGARWAAAVVLFAVPTTWMGGTFPVLVHLVTRRDDVQRRVAGLATAQSVGAVVGVLVGGLVALPSGGTSALHGAAVGASIVAAVLLARVRPTGDDEPAPPDDTTPAAAPRADAPAPPFAVLLVALALIGASLLGLEVVVTRLVALAFGSTAAAFALMLAGVLTGLALGSGAVAALRPARPLVVLATCQLAAPVALVLALPLVERLGYLAGLARVHLLTPDGGLAALQAVQAGLVVAVLLVPTAAIGAALPLAAPLAVRAARGRVGAAIGAAAAASAVGNVVGALGAALWLVPAVGPARALVVLIGVHAVGALALLVRAPARAVATPAVGVLVLVGAAALGLRPGPPLVLERVSDAFRWRRPGDLALADGEAPSFDAWRAAFVLDPEAFDDFAIAHDEHVTAVAVRRDALVSLVVNGKPDASVALVGSDMVPMLIFGHLPLLVAPDAERALVIGWGGGTTAAALLRHPIDALTAVEISPAVLEVAELFERANGRPRDDPRLELVVDDARRLLRERDETWDVIVSQPSNPWVAGMGDLFTREAFADVARRLTDDGVFAIWVPSYETDDATVALVLRTLRDVFAHVEVWATRDESFLLASRRPLRVDLDAAETRLDRARVAADLARAGRHSLASLLAMHALTDADVDALLADHPGPLNTDAHERLRHVAPQAFFTGAESTLVRDATARADVTTLRDYAAWRRAQGAPVTREEWADLLDEFGPGDVPDARRARWREARDVAPPRTDDALPRPSRAGRVPIAAMGFARAARAGLLAADAGDAARAEEALARAHAERRSHAFVALRLAQLRAERGDLPGARDVLAAALDAETPEPVAVGLRLAWVHRALGDVDAAVAADRDVLARQEHATALVRLAEHAADEQRWDDALALYRRSLAARRSNPRAAVGLANLLWTVRRDADAAIDVLDAARAGTPAGRTAIAETRRRIRGASLGAR